MKEIPYDDFFQFAGLHVVMNTTQFATAGFTTTANLGAQPEVVQVDANSDAQRLGIRVGDRVTAVNGKPADAQLDDELSRHAAGSNVSVCNWRTGAGSAKWSCGSVLARRSPTNCRTSHALRPSNEPIARRGFTATTNCGSAP